MLRMFMRVQKYLFWLETGYGDCSDDGKRRINHLRAFVVCTQCIWLRKLFVGILVRWNTINAFRKWRLSNVDQHFVVNRTGHLLCISIKLNNKSSCIESHTIWTFKVGKENGFFFFYFGKWNLWMVLNPQMKVKYSQRKYSPFERAPGWKCILLTPLPGHPPSNSFYNKWNAKVCAIVVIFTISKTIKPVNIPFWVSESNQTANM